MFYPPIGYWVGGAISVTAGTIASQAVPISMAIAGLAGFFTMYAALRRTGVAKEFAALSAAAYVASLYFSVHRYERLVDAISKCATAQEEPRRLSPLNATLG
jgi:uncharacterized membrane protein YccC